MVGARAFWISLAFGASFVLQWTCPAEGSQAQLKLASLLARSHLAPRCDSRAQVASKQPGYLRAHSEWPVKVPGPAEQHAAPSAVHVRNPGDSNVFMDRVLLTDMIGQVRFLQLDPFRLPSFETEFKDKILGIPVRGRARFLNGTLMGLSRVNRFGDCAAPGWLNGNITVACNLLIDDLDIVYDAKVKYGFAPELAVRVRSKVGTCYAHMEATAAPGKAAVLRSFQITGLGELDTKWSGLGPLNPYLLAINEGYKANIAGAVYSTLYANYKGALDQSLSRVPFPEP